MTDIVITRMIVPTRADADDATEFQAMIDLGNKAAELDSGIADHHDTAAQQLPSWLNDTDRIRRGFIARIDGAIVGAAALTTAVEAGTTSAEIELMIIPPHSHGDVGSSLLERLENEARDLDRSTLQSWTLHPAAQGDRMLIPATGWGRARSTALSDLLEARGYVLEQVERNSILPLEGSLGDAERRLAEAVSFAGADYRIVTWTLPTPPELLAGYGGMIARMATETPNGEMESRAETWDEERVRRRDATFAAGGQTMSVAAVVHEPTGMMVAFNELNIGADLAGVTHQWGTLVLKEHRGKRLGTIVKCANILRWRSIAPHSPKISTFNAEENRAMLDINEAIGFVPASYAGGWQKRLV